MAFIIFDARDNCADIQASAHVGPGLAMTLNNNGSSKCYIINYLILLIIIIIMSIFNYITAFVEVMDISALKKGHINSFSCRCVKIQ